MDGPPFESGDSVFHVSAFVESVGVDAHLHVVFVTHGQRLSQNGRRGTPVFVSLEPGHSGFHLFDERRPTGGSLTENADVDRQLFDRFQHFVNVPGTGCTGGSERAVGGSDPPSPEGGHAVGEGVPDLLGRDVMDVGVDPPGSEDKVFSGDGVGGGSHGHAGGHAVHRVGVSGFADPHDQSVSNTHISFDDTQVGVDHGDVGDHQVQGPPGTGQVVVHTHAVTHGLTTTVNEFFTVDPEVFFYFEVQVGIAQTNLVSDGGPENPDVLLA